MLKRGNYILVVFILIIAFSVWFSAFQPDNHFGVISKKKAHVVLAPTNNPTVRKTLISSSSALTYADNTKTFSYARYQTFTVTLNSQNEPENYLVCIPTDIIRLVKVSSVSVLMYQSEYEAVKDGICSLADKDFHVTIQVGSIQK